ncbi:MAG TPA: VTT domain-containing protein [Vicinamibacterales bacterium]|nr:VTT domain-containing protein [Acidobacteriota bacterium]HOC18588.1 VTT domain-containing protein [Vicinamibacterales bacterium]
MHLLHFGIYGTCFALAVLSSIFPLVNAEVVLLGYVVAAKSDWREALLFAAIMAVGQMVGKAGMYWFGRGAARVPSERTRRSIERWEARLRRSPRSVMLFVLLSASTGFPPFYVLSILVGTLRINFWAFLGVGLVGRLLRFGLIAMFPSGISRLR